MLKKAQVVMLPTKKANLRDQLCTINGKPHIATSILGVESENAITFQHLYFVTDDEIKEGDWYIAIDIKSLIKCTRITGYIQSPKNLAKKIIATTNPDMWDARLHSPMNEQELTNALKVGNNSIAKIPTDFVEAYVREQGKIEEVNLEYERTFEDQLENTQFVLRPAGYRLKLRPNGTVIVHPVKEKLYTRQEVVDLLITYSTVQVDIVAFIRNNLPII